MRSEQINKFVQQNAITSHDWMDGIKSHSEFLTIA